MSHENHENGFPDERVEEVVKVQELDSRIQSQDELSSQKTKAVDGSDKIEKEEEEGKTIKFNPPMSIQRYKAVAMCLNRNEFKDILVRMVDFGCSDMNFIKFAKRIKGVREISAVDMDETVLDRFRERAAPLISDYIIRRKHPLTVTTYRGDIVHPDDRLRGYDAVTAIELIEHLHPEVLEKVPSALFDFVRPKVAVLTTPNADFNVLFGMNKDINNGAKRFRHWDHKFEWSRREFADWCDNVVRQYPAYSVTMQGIGDGPAGSETLGRCSQMAVFKLIDENYRNDPVWLNAKSTNSYIEVGNYEHPHRPNQTPEMMIKALLYYVRMFSEDGEDYDEDEPVDIAIDQILSMPRMKKLFKTEDTVRTVLSSSAAEVCSQECSLVSKDDGRLYIRYRRLQETRDEDD